MAHKRRIEVAERVPGPEEPVDEMGWKEWALKRYARAWYWVGCLFLDVVIFLEMQRALDTHVIVAGSASVAAAAVQFALYFRIWGRGGPLADDGPDDER
jgi:hypothetical protein